MKNKKADELRTILFQDAIYTNDQLGALIGKFMAYPAERQPIFVTVEKNEPKRNLDQNALFWRWMSILEKEAPTVGKGITLTKEQWHDTICEHFLGTREYMDLKTGEVKVAPIGTSGLSRKNFAAFLTAIRDWSLEYEGFDGRIILNSNSDWN